MDELVFSVSDFVGVFNQTIEYAYPSVVIEGELANFRVSKNKWVYFDLKDEFSSVKFFGTVYMLPGPLEDGIIVQVRGVPRLHNQFGFSVTAQSIQPIGEGSIKKAAALLQTKLAKEGLFDESRKRALPRIPTKIGLITSAESAAYHDFSKIVNQRWGGLEIVLADVQVQGEVAPGQIARAIEYFTSHTDVEVLVVTRGGGSADDLAAFSTEQVVRAVAASRIPTLVAIGHEVDTSLAELAADVHASTPSNAAELLVPDKKHELQSLDRSARLLGELLGYVTADIRRSLVERSALLHAAVENIVTDHIDLLKSKTTLLGVLSPEAALTRGYAIIRSGSKIITSAQTVKIGDTITVQLRDGSIGTNVQKVVD